MQPGRRRGQAATEMALMVPILALLMLGSADLGRAFYLSIEISGASRAGMRNGVLDTSTDIGAATRGEPNSAIPNDLATWGDAGPGGANAVNGDPSGCPPSVFTGTRVACFAVRPCVVTNNICTSYGLWGTRPPPGVDTGLAVRVVYKVTPYTPLIPNFAPGGVFYLTSDTIGLQLY